MPIYFQLTLILNLKTNRRMSKVFLMFTSDGIAEKPWVWENTWHLADPTIFFGYQKNIKRSCSKNIWVGYHEYDASTASSSTLHRFQWRNAQPGSVTFVRGLTGSKKGETLSIDIRRTARATYLRYSAQFICHPCSEKDLGEFSCTVNIDVSRNGEKNPKRHSNVCWSENYI